MVHIYTLRLWQRKTNAANGFINTFIDYHKISIGARIFIVELLKHLSFFVAP